MNRIRRAGALTALMLAVQVQAQNVMTIVAGDHQTAQRTGNSVPGGMASFAPLTVQIKDKTGKPIAGVKVNFMCAAGKPAGMACQMDPGGGSSTGGTTDANGQITANKMGGKSASAYYASGKMPITAAGDNTNTVTFDLTVTDAPPPPPPTEGATMTIVAGDNQTAARVSTSTGIPTATYAPLVVLVKDASGKPLAGVIVSFSVGSHPNAMACQAEPSGSGASTITTDGAGNATLNRMGGKSASIYYADGQCQIVASYGKATATFHLNASAPVVSAQNVMTIVAGDHQTAQRTGNSVPGGMASFGPLTVQVKTPAGAPIAGVKVNFVCGSGKPAAMACQLDPGGGSSTGGTTDANGQITANKMGGKSASAYYASGKMPITAAGDNTNTVTFDLTVTDAPPPPPPTAGATMTLVSGDNQTAPRLGTSSGIPTATFAPLVVHVTDASGKVLTGVIVSFSVGSHPNAMACQTEPSGSGASTITTDGAGNATLNRMGGKSASIYYADGQCQIVATYGAATVTFHLNAGGK
jgi:hypothetical protein